MAPPPAQSLSIRSRDGGGGGFNQAIKWIVPSLFSKELNSFATVLELFKPKSPHKGMKIE